MHVKCYSGKNYLLTNYTGRKKIAQKAPTNRVKIGSKFNWRKCKLSVENANELYLQKVLTTIFLFEKIFVKR